MLWCLASNPFTVVSFCRRLCFIAMLLIFSLMLGQFQLRSALLCWAALYSCGGFCSPARSLSFAARRVRNLGSRWFACRCSPRSSVSLWLLFIEFGELHCFLVRLLPIVTFLLFSFPGLLCAFRFVFVPPLVGVLHPVLLFYFAVAGPLYIFLGTQGAMSMCWVCHRCLSRFASGFVLSAQSPVVLSAGCSLAIRTCSFCTSLFLSLSEPGPTPAVAGRSDVETCTSFTWVFVLCARFGLFLFRKTVGLVMEQLCYSFEGLVFRRSSFCWFPAADIREVYLVVWVYWCFLPVPVRRIILRSSVVCISLYRCFDGFVLLFRGLFVRVLPWSARLQLGFDVVVNWYCNIFLFLLQFDLFNAFK